MADAHGSGPCTRKGVGVQLPSRAQMTKRPSWGAFAVPTPGGPTRTVWAMNSTRIAILGCSGSGKSTLARSLGERVGLRVIELDALFHQADWVPADSALFRSDVEQALHDAEASGGWIVDGNYNSKLDDLVLAQATTVFWFDLPRRTVMRRIVSRSLRRALLREQLWNGNRERWTNLLRWDPERSIIRWAWTRHPMYRERLEAQAAASPVGQTWIRLAAQRDVDRVLAECARPM